MVDERISRAIDNDHTAAMKITSDGQKMMRKKGGNAFATAGGVYVCTICQKVFKTHHSYRKHLKLHSEKTFTCFVCEKTFTHKHYLHSHMLIHTKTQRFQCQLCSKRFSKKSNLNQHLQFHYNKRVFTCEICKKDFLQQDHLKGHMRQHTNERPYNCDVCNKSFNIKSSLQRHMNCHSGVKPFICDICSRGYTRRSVLMLHIQQVHENKKPYQCSECQTCFSQKGNLQAHFRRKHLKPKLDGKRGKDRDKVKRLKNKPLVQNLKLIKLGRSPVKAILNNHKDLYTKTVRPDPVKRLSNESKLGLGTYSEIQPTPTDHYLASEMCISTGTGVKAVEPSKLNTASIENGELFRFLSNNDDLLSDNSIDSLPTFVNPYMFADSSGAMSDEAKISSDLELILSGEKSWNDLLSDSDIFDDGVTDDSHKTNNDSKVHNPPPSCHDYASPPHLLPEIKTEDGRMQKIVYPPPPPLELVKEFEMKDVKKEVVSLKKEDNSKRSPFHHQKNNFIIADSQKSKTITFNIYKQRNMHLSNPTRVPV